MVFEKLRVRLAGILLNGHRSIYDQGGNPFLPTRSDPPPRTTEEWLESYGRSPRLGVVSKIAEDLAFTPGRLFRILPGGDKEEVDASHPFLRFLENPNPLPQFSKEAIWQLHSTYLDLTGEGFMVIEKDALGYPAELWPLPSHWVTGTPTIGYPYYRIRSPSGLFAEIHVTDMFLERELHPLDPYGRGLGKAQAIADEVETDEYAAQFEKRFFYNNATPNSVVAIEGADASAIDRFESQWNAKYQGVENAHKTAITSGRVSAVKLADNMKDLDMIAGRTFLRDACIEHFNVPREIMGITENSNRATAEAAQYIYAQNVLTPRIFKRQSAINQQLVTYWGTNLHYEYDDIIPHNQEFDKAVALEGWGVGLLMKNEARELLSMEPVENGNVYQAPMLFSYVSEDQDLTKVSTPSSMGGVGDLYDTITESVDPKTGLKQVKSSISRRDQQAMLQLERAQREAEAQAEGAANTFFNRQRRELRESLLQAQKSTEDDFSQLQTELAAISEPLKRAEVVTGFVGRMIDWNASEAQMRDMLSNIWSGSYNKGQNIMSELYNLKNPHKPEVREVFKRMGGQKISRSINDTTRGRICDIIDTGLAQQLSVEDLAKQIEDCSDLGSYRARLIAQQETYNSLSAANYDAMQAGGTRRHKWVTRGDAFVRDSHRKLNGEVRQIGERFSNGLRYPRDSEGSTDEVLKCRCWDVPVREPAAISVDKI